MDIRLAANLLTDRVAALPLAILYVTDRCNSRCVTCDYWKYGQTHFPVEQAARLASELRALGTQAVLLSGGEPLLHPHWAGIAATLREASLRLWLLTAGLSLQKHAAHAAGLCERITVSLDGATPETYRAIRGVDAFAAVGAGVRAVVGRGPQVSLRCTVQRGNYRELPALVRLARELGVAQISFLAVDVSTHVAFARLEDYERTMALRPEDLPAFAEVLDALERDFAHEFTSGFIAESPAKLRRLHQYFAALLGQAKFPLVRCNAPRFSAVIGADGHLQPCYFIPGVGQWDGQSLAAALNAPEFVALRRDIREGKRGECERCVCSMHRGPRALLASDFPPKGPMGDD
ncbi:MAG: radical SAM protein [Anaerolineales bacterium]